jgi:hypothetical protein
MGEKEPNQQKTVTLLQQRSNSKQVELMAGS